MKDDSLKHVKPRKQCCGSCSKPGHNARTCQDEEVFNGYNSD